MYYRCPFQITTTASKAYDAKWSCRITLVRKYAYDPTFKAGRDISKYNRWPEQSDLDVCDFKTVYNMDELEDILRRAQLAILNPHVNPLFYATAKIDLEQKTFVGFSPNTISLQITGPGLPELSFFDLPGAINVHEDEKEQHLVPFIEKLIKNFLKDEKVLVLLACAADQDVENSTAFRFVGDCKAKGRCMGVLTKPDLLNRTRLQHVRRILNGEVFKLGDGWFITKQPSQAELDDGVTHQDARTHERHFFARNEWTSGLVQFRSQFGTPNLQGAISQKLTSHILNDLPEIVMRVETRLAQVSAQLATFPDVPLSPSLTVMAEIQTLVAAITEHIRGDGLENRFRSQYKDILGGLHRELKAVRPDVEMKTPGYQNPAISIDSDEDDVEATPTPIRYTTATPTSSKKRKANDGTPLHPVKPEPGTLPPPAQMIFKLDQVKQAYDAGSNSGLPDQLNPKVTDHLISTALQGWNQLVGSLLAEVRTLLETMLSSTIRTSLSSRQHTQLCQQSDSVVSRFFNELMREQSEVISHLLACEQHKPMTFSSMKKEKDNIAARLVSRRLEHRINEYFDTMESKGFKPTSAADRKKKQSDTEWQQKTLRADSYGREVTALATPIAYYDIASSRLLDNIGTHLETGLMYAMQTGLHDCLTTGLRAGDNTHCTMLLAEDPGREALRARLLVEQEKLTLAMEELKALPAHGVAT